MRKHRCGPYYACIPNECLHIIRIQTLVRGVVRMHKYIGRRVEIIYQGADGRLSQRVVRVLGVQDGVVRAFCEASGAPRTFRVDGILAALPVVRRRTA